MDIIEYTVTLTKEQAECLYEELPMKAVTKWQHAESLDGELLYVDVDGEVTTVATGNEPLMNHVDQKDSDGNPIMEKAVTVQEWAQGALTGKANACMKRAYMAKYPGA